jgi:hypothetical protein
VCKSKVQPSTGCISRIKSIVSTLLLYALISLSETKRGWTYLGSHSIPLLVPDPVLRNVIGFSQKEQRYHHHIDPEQDAVSALVKWLFVGSIDVGEYDASQLNAH